MRILFLIAAVASTVSQTSLAGEPIRLTCSFDVTYYQSEFGEFMPGEFGVSGTKYVGRVTYLEFEQVPGQTRMRCEGCENPQWQPARRELPASKLVMPDGKLGGYPMPTIDLKPNKRGTEYHPHFQVHHRHRNGLIEKAVNDSPESMGFEPQIVEIQRELNYGADVHERPTQSDEERIKEYRRTGQPQFDGATSMAELRCQLLEPGQISKTEEARILSKPPAPGHISLAEYQTKGIGQRASQKFLDVLNEAISVDPDQRRMALANSGGADSVVAVLEEILPLMRDKLNANPDMTFDQMWAEVANQMGINPMSQRGIIAASLLPLAMAAGEK